MSLGNRIKELRLDKGYSQTKLAKIVKIAPPAISQYESNKRVPGCIELYNISKALGTTFGVINICGGY